MEVAFAYAGALVLTFGLTTGFVLWVGAWRAAGHPMLARAEAQTFARSATGLVACAVIEAAILSAISFGAAGGPASPLERLRLGPGRGTKLGVVAATVALVGLSAAGGAALEILLPEGVGISETFTAALAGDAHSKLGLTLLGIGLAPAFAEEVFFRGFLQRRLEPTWGRMTAVVLAAAAFGVFHLDLAQGTVAFFAGLVLGWTAERLGSVRPCIAAHAVNNLVFVLLAALAPKVLGAAQVQPWVLACGAVVFVAALALLASPAALREPRAPPPSPLSERAADP